MTPASYYLILEAAMFFLGGLGAALLYRAGIVHTGIIAQFIMSALTFAYAAQFSLSVGLVIGVLANMVILTGIFWINTFNPRTYIIVLYLISLTSIQVGDLIMYLFPPSFASSLVSPSVIWPLTPANTISLAIGFCVLASLGASWSLATRQGVLLAHWSQTSPATARDLQIAGIFTSARLLRAALPTVVLTSALFFGAVLLGCFARDWAYVSGKFNTVPFWMLLFGLLTRYSFWSLPLMVLLFVGGDWVQSRLFSTGTPQIPTQSLFLVYGVIFIALSLIARKGVLDR